MAKGICNDFSVAPYRVISVIQCIHTKKRVFDDKCTKLRAWDNKYHWHSVYSWREATHKSFGECCPIIIDRVIVIRLGAWVCLRQNKIYANELIFLLIASPRRGGGQGTTKPIALRGWNRHRSNWRCYDKRHRGLIGLGHVSTTLVCAVSGYWIAALPRKL